MIKVRLLIALICMVSLSQADDDHTKMAAFSDAKPGSAIPPHWTLNTLPNVIRATHFELVRDETQVTVLQAVSEAAAATLTHKLQVDPVVSPLLSWRWKVSRVLESADLGQKDGDDYAARVYVVFDYPLDKLPLADRVKVSIGRSLYGQELPAASLCYVWDNRHLVGLSTWSAYTDRVRMIVVESGKQFAGQWRLEQRDVAADFRAAFGEEAPPIMGVALAADTDNTGESVEAWFGDLNFSSSTIK